MNRTETAYSAIDIARILVRNPNEVTAFLTYDRICTEYCDDTPLEDLSKEQKDRIFSIGAAAKDLKLLGFNIDQINTLLQTYREAYNEQEIDQIQPDLPPMTTQEQTLVLAYSIAGFPYGPPLALTPTYNVMSDLHLSNTRTNQTLQRLQIKLADKIMEIRELDPYILIPVQYPAPETINPPT